MRHQEVVSFTRRVRKGGASPLLSPAYMIHCRPRHTGLQTFRHSSSRCSQMFALVGNSTEIFSGVKRYFSCWKNTPGCCPGWRRRRRCWCAYPSGCCCTSPLLVLLQEEEEEDKAFPTNRPAPHQHRNHLVTSGPSCSPLFSRWSILGTPVVQYLGSPQPAPTYFTRVESSTSFSGDAALVTSL